MEPEPEAGEGCWSAAAPGPADDVVGGDGGDGMANEVWRGFLAQSRVGGKSWCVGGCEGWCAVPMGAEPSRAGGGRRG